MNWFPQLRAVALLKRIALALEQSNVLTEEMLNRQFPERKGARKTAKMVTVSVADPKEWNKRWAESHPEE